jgi:hypothetical protein
MRHRGSADPSDLKDLPPPLLSQYEELSSVAAFTAVPSLAIASAHCPQCQAPADSAWNFCDQCGGQLEAPSSQQTHKAHKLMESPAHDTTQRRQIAHLAELYQTKGPRKRARRDLKHEKIRSTKRGGKNEKKGRQDLPKELLDLQVGHLPRLMSPSPHPCVVTGMPKS